MFEKIRRNKIKFAIAALVFIAIVLLWAFFIWQEEIFALLKSFSVWLKGELSLLNKAPLILFPIAILILPIVGLPVSPVYLVAGGRPENIWLVILLCFLGVVLNMALGYFIAKWFAGFIRPKIEARGIKVPEVPRDEQCDIIFLVRMIPGNPLTVQNYLLGLANVEFKRYMLVSMPVQFFQVAGYIYFSDGIINGDAANFFLGVSLLCVIAIIARMVQKRFKNGFSKKKR